MKKTLIVAFCLGLSNGLMAQLSPAITNWIQNTTGLMGRHYVNGNSTPITDNVEANVQTVEYSADWVYVHTHGIPGYITGPFLDGNPSLAQDQDAIFKISLAPTPNTGNPTNTNPGNIGVFVNGVTLFDYRDGVSYSSSAGQDQGGPGGGMGDGVWNRDAVPAERDGFDCNKAHPAMGNYHHHQNPSAFNLDLVEISDVCDMYPADGLYNIDETMHAPLIGFAYDGYPIYGAYGYKNADGTGGIVRIRSGYQLRNITTRTTYADGSNVTAGPPVNATYPLGHYREDYEWIDQSGDEYLDVHNGRFCVTPEYPNGTYCYFAAVDENWNSAYPYVVGPTFYGVVNGSIVNSVTETTTVYTATNAIEEATIDMGIQAIFPNPTQAFLAIQIKGMLKEELSVEMFDLTGKLVQSSTIYPGTTLTNLDTRLLYNGTYILKISNTEGVQEQKIVVQR